MTAVHPSLLVTLVWVDRHPLGRIWSIGPQRTAYMPGPWLRKGSNVVVFDLKGSGRGSIEGLAVPILNAKITALPGTEGVPVMICFAG